MASNMTEKWLKKNDPNFKSRDKSKYPYLTGRQMREKSDREIPVSCLTTYLAQEWTGMGRERLEEVQELFT